MASPDTEELATVPLPTPAPDVETAPQQVIEDPAAPSPDAPTAGDAAEAEPGAVGGAGLAEPGADERAVADERAAVAERAAAAGADGRAAVAGRAAAAGATERAAAAGVDEAASPETVEQAAGEAAKPAKQGGRWWRGFTGSLAAGLTVLAIGVLVVAGLCVYTDAPGPGPVLLIGHPVAAVLALLAQRVADRRNGLPAAGAGIAVVLFVVSALTLFWLT